MLAIVFSSVLGHSFSPSHSRAFCIRLIWIGSKSWNLMIHFWCEPCVYSSSKPNGPRKFTRLGAVGSNALASVEHLAPLTAQRASIPLIRGYTKIMVQFPRRNWLSPQRSNITIPKLPSAIRIPNTHRVSWGWNYYLESEWEKIYLVMLRVVDWDGMIAQLKAEYNE